MTFDLAEYHHGNVCKSIVNQILTGLKTVNPTKPQGGLTSLEARITD